MKKFLSMTLALVMLLSTLGISGLATDAEGDSAVSATVYITISNASSLVLTQEAVTVTDIDNDGSLTVNDALYCAHEAKYDGGAAAGYSSYYSSYGLSIGKLWGTDNGGSYGYYINNNSAWSLADTIKEGDYLTAFVYSDHTAWSDTYCWFDVNTANATAGDAVTLTLFCYAYDADWNMVVTPVAGATITLDGMATEYKTDADGKVTITLDKAGSILISATSDEQTLVPPVCKASVAEKVEDTTPDTTPDTTHDNTDPDNGDKEHTVLIVCILVAVVVAAGVGVFVVIKRKKN